MCHSTKPHYGAKSLLLATLAASSAIGCHGQGDGQSAPSQTGLGAGTCADPIFLQPSAPLTGQSTADATNVVSGDDPTCLGYATHGGERVYKVMVPATGSTKLHLEVTPDQSPSAEAFDPVIYLSEMCSANPVCVAGQDTHGGGGGESLDFVNTSGEEKSLYVVVDGYDFQLNGGAYTLMATLAAP